MSQLLLYINRPERRANEIAGIAQKKQKKKTQQKEKGPTGTLLPNIIRAVKNKKRILEVQYGTDVIRC